MKRIISWAFCLILVLPVFAQSSTVVNNGDTANYPYWVEMMKDPKANFFKTQSAFNAYWEGREITRGSGYKPFKRWEYFMRTRVDEFGNLPSSNQVYDAYTNFKKEINSKAPSGDWKIVGPIDLPNPESGQPNGLGRINVIAFHPFSENTIYVGAPSGGFWRTYDNGNTWETTTDNLPTLGVSAIAVNPIDPNIIYLGTGDRDAGDAPGMGIYKSIDGGTTWKKQSLGDYTINKLLIHPQYPDILFAATSNGIYKTTNGGETWSLRIAGNSKSMEFKPLNPNTVYAIIGGSFYKSADNGESWGRVSNGLQTWTRAVLGVSKQNPEYLYILSTNTLDFKALYFSENSGEKFVTKSTTPNIMGWQWNGSDAGGQAWYDLCMSVDPANANTIYSGGVNVFKSTDNGTTWKINAHWVGTVGYPVHADHHDLAYNPLNNRLYSANDGGLYYTDNGGSTWINISGGIVISQIYKIGQSATKRDSVLAGNQDNGTSFYDRGNWRTILGGDGMECLFDHTQEKYRYASLYYGQIYRSINGGSFNPITGTISDQGGWVTPYILNEDLPKTMYVGMKKVWRTTNVQATTPTWTNISSSISTGSDFVALENSPANSEILYASSESNKMYRTDNANASSPTWTTLSNVPTTIVTDIEAHPYNENIVYITTSSYSVLKSTDKGVNWTRITANLPRVNYSSIAYDITSNEGLYVGTDVGVFYKDATMTNWILYSTGLPVSAEVSEIEIFYDANDASKNVLRASTYGRGLWESPLYSESITAGNAARILELSLDDDTLYPNDSISAYVKVKNIGSEVINDLTIAYTVDNEPYKYASYTLATASEATEKVMLPKFVSGIGNHVLNTAIVAVNSQQISSTLAYNFEVLPANLVELSLTTDLTASETFWKITDSNNNVLYSAPSYANNIVYNIKNTYYFTTGCYKFIIYDANGICCTNGNGSFMLTNLTTAKSLGSGAEFTISDTVEFCIETMPVPNFKALTTDIAVNNSVTYSNLTVDAGYTYSWNFGDGAEPATMQVAQPGSVLYTTPGAKTVNLKVSTSTGDNVVNKTIAEIVKVYDKPKITIQPVDIYTCPFTKVELVTLAKGYGISYKWYFGSTQIGESFDGKFVIENIQPSQAGKYHCIISNKSFFVGTDTIDVVLNAIPELSLTVSDSIICNGNGVTLNATGNGTITWLNGVGTGTQVIVTPSQSTSYMASILDQNGCTNTKEITVTVATTPVIKTHPIDTRLCEDENLVLSVNASGGALNYVWKLDGKVVSEGSNVYYIDSVTPQSQGYTLCEVSNVCNVVISNSAYVSVDPKPIAGFYYEKSGNTVTFIDTAKYAVYYKWDFGDGLSSTSKNPSHNYADGEYRVLQSVENDCGTDTVGMWVKVFVGVEDHLLTNEKLKLYPNPAQLNFQLEYVSEAYNGPVYVTMMNIEGKIIMKQELQKEGETLIIPFDITNYSKGMYQLQVQIGDRSVTRKVIIN